MPWRAFFNLALAILVAAVSIYSFGYLKEFEGKRNIGVLWLFVPPLTSQLDDCLYRRQCFPVPDRMGSDGACRLRAGDVLPRRPGDPTSGIALRHHGAHRRGVPASWFCPVDPAPAAAPNSPASVLLRPSFSGGQQTAVFVLFFLGFGIKAGVIPFHIWLPAAHPVAPSNVSALLSGIVIKSRDLWHGPHFPGFAGRSAVLGGLAGAHRRSRLGRSWRLVCPDGA